MATFMKEKANPSPKLDVTRDEFIRRCIADGLTPEKAQMHAKISETLGANTVVGGVALRIMTA